MTFEAAFGPDGAICVAHPRLSDDLPLATLGERYPRLAGHLGAACDEQTMGLVYVRSFGPDRAQPPRD
jgi:hypothetical protein